MSLSRARCAALLAGLLKQPVWEDRSCTLRRPSIASAQIGNHSLRRASQRCTGATQKRKKKPHALRLGVGGEAL
jgi:hypothetical protein